MRSFLSSQATSNSLRTAIDQEPPQPLPGAGQARHHCSDRQTADLSDLFVTEALQLAQDQGFPELDGKAFKCLQKILPRRTLEQLHFRALAPVLDVVNLRIKRGRESLCLGALQPGVSRAAPHGQGPGLAGPAPEFPEESNGKAWNL